MEIGALPSREASQRQRTEKHLHLMGEQEEEMRQHEGQGHLEAREAGEARVQ